MLIRWQVEIDNAVGRRNDVRKFALSMLKKKYTEKKAEPF
jgi:hypothetical protein